MSAMPAEYGMDPKWRDFDRRHECAGNEDNSRQTDNNQFKNKEKRRWLQR